MSTSADHNLGIEPRRAANSRAAVCVPVAAGTPSLAPLLDGFDRLERPEGTDLQVVVSIDGRDDALAAACRERGALVLTAPASRGSYAARNAAVAALEGSTDVVLFTDADAVVAPDWLAAHLRTLEGADRSGGAVVTDLGSLPTPAAWVDHVRHLDQRRYVEELGFAATVNLAVRREVLDSVRFDDRMRSGGDFLFGQACAAAGFTIAYSPDAVVAHAPRATAAELLRKVRRVARGAVSLAADGQPAARRHASVRRSPLTEARHAGVGSTWWRARTVALDAACSLLYAATVPSVVLPGIRRRLRLAR